VPATKSVTLSGPTQLRRHECWATGVRTVAPKCATPTLGLYAKAHAAIKSSSAIAWGNKFWGAQASLVAEKTLRFEALAGGFRDWVTCDLETAFGVFSLIRSMLMDSWFHRKGSSPRARGHRTDAELNAPQNGFYDVRPSSDSGAPRVAMFPRGLGSGAELPCRARL
jgi:hypothetical protein